MTTAHARRPFACVGVLLAAGHSRRMEATKQLLPWPPPPATPPSPALAPEVDRAGTVVEASFDLLAPFCARIVVVLDHEADAIRRALGARPYTAALGDGNAPMFQSISLGLRAAMGVDPAAPVLLHPADHPAVAPATVRHLLEEANRRPDQAIVPVHGDRGGHPVLIPPALSRAALDFDGHGGLRAFWRSCPDACHRLPVDDPTVTMDVDTPEQYEALRSFVVK